MTDICPDVAIVNWNGGYAFLVNNPEVAAVRLTLENGEVSEEVIPGDRIPYAFCVPSIPAEYVFIDAEGNDVQWPSIFCGEQKRNPKRNGRERLRLLPFVCQKRAGQAQAVRRKTETSRVARYCAPCSSGCGRQRDQGSLRCLSYACAAWPRRQQAAPGTARPLPFLTRSCGSLLR